QLHQGAEQVVLGLQRFRVGLIAALQNYQRYELAGGIDVGVLERTGRDRTGGSCPRGRDGRNARGLGLSGDSAVAQLQALLRCEGGYRDLADVDSLSVRIRHADDAGLVDLDPEGTSDRVAVRNAGGRGRAAKLGHRTEIEIQ